MNGKRYAGMNGPRRGPVLALIAVLLFGSAALSFAQTLSLRAGKHEMIAPVSVAIVPGSGASGIAVLQVDMETDTSTVYINEIVVTRQAGDTLGTGSISNVRAFLAGANEKFSSVATTSGLFTTAYATGATTVTVTTTDTTATVSTTGKRLFVVFDYASSTPTPNTIGYYVTSITYGTTPGGPFLSTFTPGSNPSNTTTVNDFEAGFAATGEQGGATPKQPQGALVSMLKLVFGNAGDEAVNKVTSGVTVRFTGTTTTDIDPNGVSLYVDTGDSAFDSAVDTLLDSSPFSGNSVTLNPLASNTFSTTPLVYFVVVSVSATATIGNTVSMEIQNPSTDIIFSDSYADGGGVIQTDYPQVGYITATGTTPTMDNSFTIVQSDDGQAPQVSATVPDNGTTGVDRDTNITVIFSETMQEDNLDPGWVEDTANYELKQTIAGTPVSLGVVSYSAPSKTLILDPATTLNWGTEYAFTVKSTVEDYYGTQMGVDDVRTFTTETETPPYVSSRTPAAGATQVAVNTTIQVTFSEDMNTATYAGNFELRDSLTNLVTGEVTPSGLRTLVFTPGSVASPVDLDYEETYTVSVLDGVADLEGSTMGSPASWTFTTIREYPPFEEPIAVNNRIVSGGNQEVLIFVPEPPAGASDRMSVQVFTTTGKLVRTFYRDTAYSTISASLPILWDGTNGSGRPLGPGMYFVQIRATNYKRVLKVLIVR